MTDFRNSAARRAAHSAAPRYRLGRCAPRRTACSAVYCARIALIAVVIAAGSGCADMSYNRLKLGAVPRDYDRALPTEQTRRTDLGLCYLEKRNTQNRVDAIIVLWTVDRRIYAKVQTTYREREYGFTRRGEYHLRGELNACLGGMQGAAPTDMLRAIIVELNAFRGERGALEAYGWVVSGLMRIVSQQLNDPAAAEPTGAATDYLDRVPATGTASLRESGDVVYFDYRASGDLR